MRGLRREARGWREKIDGDKRGGEQLLRPSWPSPIENLPQLHPWGPRIHPYIAHALLFYASQTASSHSFSPRAPAVYNLQFLSSRLLVPIHHHHHVATHLRAHQSPRLRPSSVRARLAHLCLEEAIGRVLASAIHRPLQARAYGQVSIPSVQVFHAFLIFATPSRTHHIGGSDDFNVVFVGAGNIMFGASPPRHISCTLEITLRASSQVRTRVPGTTPSASNSAFFLDCLSAYTRHAETPHSKLGPRLKVVALIDPAVERATAVLQKKCETFVRSAYENTRVFKTLEDFVRNMSKKDMPRAIIVGSPPMFRGTLQSGRDIETQIMKYFPGVAMFIEKPAATGPASELPEAFQVAKAINESGTLCSVGYMLRYLRAVQMMKQIINENNLTVMATIARYACAYEAIAKPDWWDKSKSAGPIIEQGTHFCDLSRYFGGEVDMSTVNAHSLEWDENAGHLSKMSIDETAIPPENRIPRVTAATWCVLLLPASCSLLQ